MIRPMNIGSAINEIYGFFHMESLGALHHLAHPIILLKLFRIYTIYGKPEQAGTKVTVLNDIEYDRH